MWIQSEIKDGDLKLQKVLGKNNVADHDQGCRSMGFGQVYGSDEFHLDARSRGQSISRSVVWHIFMNGLAFISTEGGVKILPMRWLLGETPYLQWQ